MAKNIVLCGFMGSGKTVVSKKLARRLGMERVDSDQCIVERAGKSISDIFAQDGEEAFEALQRQVVEELSRREGIIIATGGGVVLRRENVEALRRNGIIFYLHPSLRRLRFNLMNDHSRPRLEVPNKAQMIEKLSRERDPLYRAAADHVIDGDRLGETVNRIIAIYQESEEHDTV
ncbi:MAG: shikimate kinase [Eubacteriales bacterium]|jgi:shikimate kinase